MDPLSGEMYDPWTPLPADLRERLVEVSGPDESLVELSAHVREAVAKLSPDDARTEAQANLDRLHAERRKREQRRQR